MADVGNSDNVLGFNAVTNQLAELQGRQLRGVQVDPARLNELRAQYKEAWAKLTPEEQRNVQQQGAQKLEKHFTRLAGQASNESVKAYYENRAATIKPDDPAVFDSMMNPVGPYPNIDMVGASGPIKDIGR